MKTTKVINFFGAPCSGKSTIAAGLFFKLKILGYEVELVTEFAKELVWLERKVCLQDQFYVIAQQNHRMVPLVGTIDYIITDSPILLGALYQAVDYVPSFTNFLLDIHHTYDNINYFLKRDFSFSNIGRHHTEQESQEINNSLLKFLLDNKIQFEGKKSKESTVDEIVIDLMHRKQVEKNFLASRA